MPGYARQLEEWGYDHIWCPDERFERSPYAVLTLAARATERARLGISVTNPYTRHPLITGAAVATVNEASGGRAVLGLGAGASSLFERQGIKRPSPPVTAIREAVELLRPFMRGERVDFGGRTYSFRGADIDFESRPVPIYIAARGPRLLRLAGEVADGVIIGSLTSREGLEYALENVMQGLERSNRDLSEFDVVLWAYTSIRKEKAEDFIFEMGSDFIPKDKRRIILNGDEEFFKASREYFLNHQAAILAAVELPYPDSFEQLKRLDKKLKEDYKKDTHSILTNEFMSAIDSILSLDVRSKTHSNAIKAAIEIYLIRARTGRLPDALPDGLPGDLYSGKDFKYEKTADGFTLRCRGKDMSKDEIYKYEFKVK